MTIQMIVPAGTTNFIGISGTAYTPNLYGLVALSAIDVPGAIAAGFIQTGNLSTVGTAATGSTAYEFGNETYHRTVLVVSTTLPAIAGGAALGIGKLLYTLPAGAQVINHGYISMAITQTEAHINSDTPTVGLGYTIASGVVSVLSGTAGFQNILVGTAAANCTGTATVVTTLATASPFGLVTAIAGAKTIYFNAAATWAASGDVGALLTGTTVIDWTQMR